MQTFLLQSARNHPNRVVFTSEIQSIWPDTEYAPVCIGCEAAMTQGPSRDHTEQCRTRIMEAMSSDVALSGRVRDAHNRMSRQPSDAETGMKNVRFAQPTAEHGPLAVSTSHTLSTTVTHGGSTSSSSSRPLPSVLRARSDDSDERIGSKKLRLSE